MFKSPLGVEAASLSFSSKSAQPNGINPFRYLFVSTKQRRFSLLRTAVFAYLSMINSCAPAPQICSPSGSTNLAEALEGTVIK